MAGQVRIEVEGALGRIVFDHPERRNALTPAMWSGLAEAARRLAAADEVRVVVMRGAGEEAFVSGADISRFDHASGGATAAAIERDTGDAFRALGELDKPLIALVHGFCVGGGVAIAVAADLRYASDDAVFAIPAARLGVAYDIDLVRDLVLTVGEPHAKEILFTGNRYPAREALAMGLVNRVLNKDKLDGYVEELAGRIAANAPLTLRSLKIACRELRRPPGERDVDRVRAAMAACFASDDFSEGVTAFLHKRDPHFKGR